MTETLRVRCAVCNEYQNGEVSTSGTELSKETYNYTTQKQERRVYAVQKGKYWLCFNHRDCEILPVTVGAMVLTEPNVHKYRYETVKEIKPNGVFTTGHGHNSYNPFGRRIRGMGQERVYRVATPSDIEVINEMLRADKEEREKSEAESLKEKKFRDSIATAVKNILPESLKDVVVVTNRWNDDDYEVCLYLKPSNLEALNVGVK